MLGSFFKRVHTWLVASHRNDFHPHLLAERGLLVLFALILGAEAFLVSNVVSTEAGTPSLAAVGNVNTLTVSLPPFIAGISRLWYGFVVQPLTNIAMAPGAGRIAFLTLVLLAAALMGLFAHTLSARRRRFQQIGYMAGGTMLLFAVTLLFFDMQYLLPAAAGAQQAANIELAAHENKLAAMLQSASVASSSTAMGEGLPTSTKAASIKK